jgi:hypothetical protein
MWYKKSHPWIVGLIAFLGVTCAPQDESASRVSRFNLPDGGDIAPVPAPPAVKVPEQLKERIDVTLEHVRRRDLLTDHSFWTIFHGILGMGPEDAFLVDTRTGKRMKAIDYICDGGQIRGLEFVPTADGLDVVTWAGTGVGQGHQDQFIAEIAQWGMPADRPFTVNGKRYTFADFINHCKMRARVTEKQELSWAIIIIGTYLGTDYTWTNKNGEKLAFEDVVRYESNEPIVHSPVCGGTHRLFGLTWAYHLHCAKGGAKTGVWNDVAEKTAEFIRLARKYQNADGSFSTDYFVGPGNVRDTQRRLATTGHILEWLALALSDEELRAPWMQEAASALALMILENSSRDLDGGALYHAAHGLAIYRTRVFGPSGAHAPLIPPPPK